MCWFQGFKVRGQWDVFLNMGFSLGLVLGWKQRSLSAEQPKVVNFLIVPKSEETQTQASEAGRSISCVLKKYTNQPIKVRVISPCVGCWRVSPNCSLSPNISCKSSQTANVTDIFIFKHLTLFLNFIKHLRTQWGDVTWICWVIKTTASWMPPKGEDAVKLIESFFRA